MDPASNALQETLRDRSAGAREAPGRRIGEWVGGEAWKVVAVALVGETGNACGGADLRGADAQVREFVQAQARWLPTYMRRWLVFGVLAYAGGAFVELVIGAPAVSALLYVPGALSVPVNAVTVVVWIGLKALSAPL